MSLPVDLEALAERLSGRYRATRPALSVRVSNGGRQLVMAPEGGRIAGPAPGLLRRTRKAPKGKAFELYVTLEDSAAARPSQRVVLTDEIVRRLEIDGDLRERSWTLPQPGGASLIVHFRPGDEMTPEDARQLFEILNGELSS